MNVTFVYTDNCTGNRNKFHIGVATLAACLKRAGFNVSLVHLSEDIDKAAFMQRVRDTAPDVLAFSYISLIFPEIEQLAAWAAELGLPTIHGGVHPTIAPEESIALPGVTAVCRGEGEAAIVEFCRNLQEGKSIENITSLWVKDGDRIIRNEIRPLITDLGTIPFPDLELFRYEQLEDARVHKRLDVQASRGCYYRCTYCLNDTLRNLYPNKKQWLRFKKVDTVMEEIEAGLRKYPFLTEIRFIDDTLTQDKPWFREFAEQYRRRIGLPFSGNDRVTNIDDEAARLLKEIGCTYLALGIESGDEQLRNQVMRKGVSDKAISDAFRILKEHGIKRYAFNILGMPGETPRTALATLKLNARVKPDRSINAFFFPLKGTDAYNVCLEKGYLSDKTVSSFFDEPVINLDSIRHTQLKFYFRYFKPLTRLYGALLKEPPGKEGPVVWLVDRLLTLRCFPYTFLTACHVRLLRYPRLYAIIRKPAAGLLKLVFRAK